MVLTPHEVEARSKPDPQELERLEDMIDRALVEDRKKGRQTTIATSLFPDKTTAETIAAKYRQAGWAVKSVSDQRDGDFYTFTRNRDLSNQRYSADNYWWDRR